MNLYIVRHAYAGERGDPRYPDDSLRPVTKKGAKMFTRLLKSLCKRSLAPMAIGTSPLTRCIQTAELLAKYSETNVTPEQVDAFAPGCEVDDVVNWVRNIGAQNPAYVGHAPDVDRIAAAFLGTVEDSIHFAKGAIAAIEFAEEPATGKGKLRWLVTPKNIG